MTDHPTSPEPRAVHSTAHYLLEGLNDIGIDYIFSNFGTDHVTLIEEMAAWERQQRPFPRIVLCPHENVAVHMAAGYAALTGRGQAVMVHVDAGTANAAMGLHNMFRGRLPVLLMAGKAPHTLRGELPGSRDNYVHFVQDPFDMASVVRPYTKWEYTLPTGVVAREALRRAHSVMQSDPPGPVYMTLPRETLAEGWRTEQVQGFSSERFGSVQAGGIDPTEAEAIARELMAAEQPIAISAYLGRKTGAVAALEALAMRCGIRVFEFMPSSLCVSRELPCFGGFDPSVGMKSADVGLLLDVDVPWLPKFASENPATRWTHIDVDTIKRDFPMWGFPSHRRLQADCARSLEQVLGAVERLATPAFEDRVARRIEGWKPANEARHAALARAAESPGTVDAISPDFLCAMVGRAIGQDDIVINEAIRNSPAVLGQVHRTRALTLLGCAGGGLGYSGGMALGAKLARPLARVVQFVGDGGFHFSTPSSVYAAAQNYALPILTVVLDNGGWQAVKEAVLRVYPEGEAAAANQYQARLAGPVRDFQKIAEAFGGHGEQVRDPAELEAALARCLQAVDHGRTAVLHVRVSPL